MSRQLFRPGSVVRRVAAGVLVAGAAMGLTLSAPGMAAAAVVGAAPAAASSGCRALIPFHPLFFHRPLTIDNRFLPMAPGTQLTLEGTRSDDGSGPLPHQVVFTVTDLTKVVDGVTTRVIFDVDRDEGQVDEAELAFFAQDDLGDVWNLGEYPEEYENGRFTGAPDTWIGGLAGAEPGIHMLFAPLVGAPEYRQGSAPDIDFLDCARVTAAGGRVCVPVSCFRDVLTTRERSPLDPDGGAQTKDHAPGVGIVRVGAVNDPEGETLVLVKRTRLTAQQLADVREQALQLDRRGHRVSAVYAKTPPATGPRP